MKKILASFIVAMAIVGACFANSAYAALPQAYLEKAFQDANATNKPIKTMIVYTEEDYQNLKSIIYSNGSVIVGEFKARISSKPANFETDGYQYRIRFK